MANHRLRIGHSSASAASIAFDSVSLVTNTGNGSPPADTSSRVLLMQLHESGGGEVFTSGVIYEGTCSGLMAYDGDNTMRFSTVALSASTVTIRPYDGYRTSANAFRESDWIGFKDLGTSEYTLITERRVQATLNWAKANMQFLANKTCLIGGSMGAWGTLTFGLRRPQEFAALYANRPKWRYNNTTGNVSVRSWNASTGSSVAVASAPNIRAEHGGGNLFTRILNNIAHVSDTNNVIPWVGWNIGRNDGFSVFADHVDAVTAMRAAKRGFAFVWDNSNHSGAIPLMDQITASYPYGTFEIGKGYPLFTNHSGDQDPAVDLTGGINIGLSFRNVVESAGAWSCEVTSILGARTVDVEPISEVFTASVTPESVSIPAANTWVPVSFSA